VTGSIAARTNSILGFFQQFRNTQLMMETAQQGTPKGLRRSTLRKSAMSEKV